MIQTEIKTGRKFDIFSINYELKVSDELIFRGESPESIIQASQSYNQTHTDQEVVPDNICNERGGTNIESDKARI